MRHLMGVMSLLATIALNSHNAEPTVIPLSYIDAPTTALLIERAVQKCPRIAVSNTLNALVFEAGPEMQAAIMKLCRELDQPEEQVILEALVVESTIEPSKLLGFEMNTPPIITPRKQHIVHSIASEYLFNGNPLIYEQTGPGFGTTHLFTFRPDETVNPFSLDSLDPLNPLIEDLFGITFFDLVQSSLNVPNAIQRMEETNPNATILSWSRGHGQGLEGPLGVLAQKANPGGSGVWQVAQILSQCESVTILARPHLIVKNHVAAQTSVRTIRRVVDVADATSNAGIIIPQVDLPAQLSLRVVPHIHNAEEVTLQVNFSLDDFPDTTDDTREIRSIKTNARTQSNNYLICGGLVRHDTSEIVYATPVLSKIPLLGWLFQNRNQYPQVRVLYLFIRPEIVPLKKGIQHAPQPLFDLHTSTRNTVYHVYELIHQDAQNIADTLRALYAQDHTIAVSSLTDPAATTAGGIFSGQNSVVIRSTQEAWPLIKAHIDQLDTPAPYVMIEGLVVDMETLDIKNLTTLTRNPLTLLPKNIDFRTTWQLYDQTAGAINFTTLAEDLLAVGQAGFSRLALFDGQSLFISANDPTNKGIWQLSSLTHSMGKFAIISRPYVISRQHQTAESSLKQIRRFVMTSFNVGGQNTVSVYKDLIASLSLRVVPHICDEDTVNLGITFYADEFLNDRQFDVLNTAYGISIVNGVPTLTEQVAGDPTTRVMRSCSTTARVRSGDTFVFGGLLQNQITETFTATPFLSKIPIIGDLFKSRDYEKQVDNLIIFIKPTIITPKNHAPLRRATVTYIDLVRPPSTEVPRDPIYRLFFASTSHEALYRRKVATILGVLRTQQHAERNNEHIDHIGVDKGLRKKR